jgi:N-acetylglucosamine-6-phosphate deacetylase
MADAAAELAEHVHDGLVEAIHFEGPFLSPARRGAHDPSLLREPEPQAVKRLIDACHGAPFMFTIAPELPGAMRAIRAIVESGGVAAIGHTNATYDLAVEAVKAGASVATHLFNAMPPVHHRNPGAIVALVEQERVVLELINDGEHVDKALVRCLLAGTKPGRIALVSDAMAAAGMADGIYRVGGLAVEVKAGIARLQSDGSLAGSTLTVDASLRRAIAAGLPALSVFVAATATPARAIGIHGRVGSLEVGRRADLVLLEEDFQVQGVMTGGDWTVPVGPPAADGREHRQGANG